MTDEDLHDEIDELAVKTEKLIKRSKEINEEFDGQFDPKYRRMQEANAADILS